MSIFKRIFNRILSHLPLLNDFIQYHKSDFPPRSKFGKIAKNCMLQYPIHAEWPQTVFIEENTRIRSGVSFINSPSEKIIIRKYSAIGPCTLFIPGNHTSTVGVPHFLLGLAHINDKSKDIIVEEDCWVGANVTLLSGAHLGRGCIVATGSIVSKEIPPYAVVVGTPARIIARKFELEDIIQHEKALYRPEERMTRQQLEAIFAEHFEGKKTFGTNAPLSPEQLQRINHTKSWSQFIEPF